MTLNPIKIITNLGWMHEDHYFLAFKKVPKKRGGEVGTIPWKQMSRSYLEQWWSKSQQLFLGDDLPQHPREKKIWERNGDWNRNIIQSMPYFGIDALLVHCFKL